MIRIENHPIWNGSSLFGKVNPLKKRAHILRFYMAKIYAKRIPREKVIGVTGSVGKTSTVLACSEVLSELGTTISSLETSKKVLNMDPVFNLPQTILRFNPRVKRVVLEMGIEYPGEMDLWLSLVKPGIGILTAISLQHSQYLGSKEKIAEEKGKLIEQLPQNGAAILNWDDLYCRKMAEKTHAEVIFYGTDQKNCHVWASNIRVVSNKIVFELNYNVERVEVHSNFTGKHQIYPLLAASALGLREGLKLTTIKKALERLGPIQHRMEVETGINGSTVIDDTYNAAPISVEEAIESLNYIPAKRRILVLGEMRELGEFSEKMHRQVAEKIFKDGLDLVILGEGDTKYVADELIKLGYPPQKLEEGLDNGRIIKRLEQIASKGDLILIKGARGVRMDEIVTKVIKKH